MNFKKISMAIGLLLCASLSFGQDPYMAERKLKKSYPANTGSYVELSNQYGDVEILAWAKDSVRIEVTVRTYSQKYEWRTEMLESINVDFTRTSGFIIVETAWGADANIWRKNTYAVSKEFGTNRIEVNYKVWMPVTMPLEISNRFGNVFMGNHEAELKVDVEHGDFRARNLNNVRSLDVRYGKVKINELLKGQVDLGSGSTFDLDKGGDLMISSSSSQIEIDQVNSLNISSKHDDLFIERPISVNGSFNLSDLKIGRLKKDLKATCKYGSVRIQEVSAEADRVSIDGTKTSIVLGLPVDFAGRFDMDVDGEQNLSYPKEMFIVSANLNEEKRLNVQGSMGKDAGTLISISSTSGAVKIGN